MEELEKWEKSPHGVLVIMWSNSGCHWCQSKSGNDSALWRTGCGFNVLDRCWQIKQWQRCLEGSHLLTVMYVRELEISGWFSVLIVFYAIPVVVHLTVCSTCSAGYVLCCQLPFDIIDFSCQTFLDRMRCKESCTESLDHIQTQNVWQTLWDWKAQIGIWGKVGPCWFLFFFFFFFCP